MTDEAPFVPAGFWPRLRYALRHYFIPRFLTPAQALPFAEILLEEGEEFDLFIRVWYLGTRLRFNLGPPSPPTPPAYLGLTSRRLIVCNGLWEELVRHGQLPRGPFSVMDGVYAVRRRDVRVLELTGGPPVQTRLLLSLRDRRAAFASSGPELLWLHAALLGSGGAAPGPAGATG